MKAVRQVGVARIAKFLWISILTSVLRRAWLPPLRVLLLRVFGAQVGSNVVLQRLSLINVDRGGFRALQIGDDCFIGDDVLLDLAAPITLGRQVTLAARAVILTHMNVGYQDHPLQQHFPSRTASVTIDSGAFVGACSTILAGVSVGREAFIAAGSLVHRNVSAGEVVGGVPVRPLRPSAG